MVTGCAYAPTMRPACCCSLMWGAPTVAEAPVAGFHSTYSTAVPLIWRWMQRIPFQEPSTVEEQRTAEVKETAYCREEGPRATGSWGPPPPGPGRRGWFLGTSKRTIVHTSSLLLAGSVSWMETSAARGVKAWSM